MRYDIPQTWNRLIATLSVAALLGAGLSAGAAQPDQPSGLRAESRPQAGTGTQCGPESLVEVVASDAVKFSFAPIVVSGKMHILENDIVYYRLTDAKSVKY
jgi:hypothetical protein